MIKWLHNQRIGKKFGILGATVVVLIVFDTIGMIEIGKTGYLQFLEREHIELALLMRSKLEQFKQLFQNPETLENDSLITARAADRLEMGLQPLLAETLLQPQRCLDGVNGIEVLVFRIIGFGEAFDLCEKDIVDATNADKVIEDYLSQRIAPDKFIDSFQTHLSEIEKNSRRFSVVVPEARDTVKNIILIATVILSFGVLGMFFLIANMIRKPIVSMAERIKDIAEGEGDLIKRLEIISHDEIGDTAHWFNLFVEKLQDIIIRVKSAADNVGPSSQAMSSSSEEMSQGASAHAAAAEEASSSMEEMAANIRQNTDNALQTEKIAVKAAEDARSSDQTVAEAVTAMQEIAKKISIIEDITRQSRMLSLNATIEAA